MQGLPLVFKFILDLLNIIAWPIIIFLIVFLLRKPLTHVIKNIKSLNINGVEINFDKKVNYTYNKTKSIIGKISENDKKSLFMQRVYAIAKSSPVSVIPFSYHQIENTFLKAFEHYNEDSIFSIMENFPTDLFKRNLINEREYTLFNDVKDIYYFVLNNKEIETIINKKLAIKYGKMSYILINKINELLIE